MTQLDMRLKELARSERTPLPEGYRERFREQLESLPEKGLNRPRRLAAVAVAACLCVALMGAAAVGLMKVKVLLLDPAQGVSVQTEMTAYPPAERPEEFQAWWEEADLPGDVLTFAAIGEAREFLGVPLRDNPLVEEGLGTPLQMGYEAGGMVLRAEEFQVDGMPFQLEATVALWEEGVPADGWLTSGTDGHTRYTQEEYQMENGETALIVTDNTGGRYASPWNAVDAWFVADGVRYRVRFGDGGEPARYERQAELLEQVLDAFT